MAESRAPARAADQPYDTIVVGTGIGGLTAAAILARAGQRVLAIERHDRVGGYAHSFRRGQYHFDAAVHLVGGGGEGGLLDRLLRVVGARQSCEMLPVSPCYRVNLPGFSLAAPTGLAAFTQTYQEAFPHEARGIDSFLRQCSTLRRQTQQLLEGERATPSALESIHRYRRATVADAIGEHVADAKARAAMTTLWPYLGLPPAQLSFLYWAAMLMSYIEDGAYYCKGTFQVLANALADTVRNAGGEVRLKQSVERIDIDSDGVRAVQLEGGERIESRCVISNADARQTVEKLVGRERLPTRYTRAFGRLRPSVSALVAYIACDLPSSSIADVHETFYYDSWDHEDAFSASTAGTPTWFTVTVPTLLDPDLAPPGESLIVYTTLVAHAAESDWRAAKAAHRERILRALDGRIADLSSHLKVIEVGTPTTMHRYTHNSDGALYGWELTPSQIGPGRPAATTPIPGLHLAGHWTQPGGGIYGVVTSGVLAARAVLGYDTDAGLWRSLERAH